MKGMAPCNPFYPAPRPPNRTVLADRLDEVIAARRLKPTLPSHQRAQRPLVKTCRRDEQRAGQVPELLRPTAHERLSSSCLARSSVLAWSRLDTAINDSRICSSAGGDWPRTTQTRSSGGKLPGVVRNASRSSRFQRLRT